ncbi:ATP-binding protein [Planktothrix sp. FACHB-1355]|uniref:ATP-binding protein n=1 Tax=Aerosakkonema funiforme FACHB-1375 TaxID=2949571 RepID=A0A926ZKL0_9CYAN|nr:MULTISPECIES: ATP-binding protein [Oscillatoriales]MBD2184116.1 ATP-binding protein [Aerosakkonema funiforme FACHB-1375]MBD3557830.1 ATP-binding protein [Planktothrix sp. FACHB-1355]
MAKLKIPKRVSTTLLSSLSAGVVPRIGLEHIAVGREKEMAALLQDLENIAAGGAAFRFVVGRYGSGKSFLLQLIRNHAMEQGFVVADVDLSPERRLAATDGQGVASYRELMRNIATKTHPNGGALGLILEKWISSIQTKVAETSGMRPNDTGFDDQVESTILAAVKNIEGLVHGFDFATVVSNYWRGYRLDDKDKKDAALRWLRGEFATKTEAKAALGVRVIIDDDTWYDYVKLVAKFAADIGYKGLLMLIDEAVHLWKISNAVSRQNNYDKLLAMFNDTMQGRAEHLGIIVGGTPKFLEDPKRGLFNDPAWTRRTAKSRFVKAGLQDNSGPVIQLETLTQPEILQLLQRLADVHATHYGSEKKLTNREFDEFLQEVISRLGANALLTPGEIVRDFLSVLNILQQNSEMSFEQIIHGTGLQLSSAVKKSNGDEDGEVAEFTL